MGAHLGRVRCTCSAGCAPRHCTRRQRRHCTRLSPSPLYPTLRTVSSTPCANQDARARRNQH
eukprot:525421-Rhodomonas_salina.6